MIPQTPGKIFLADQRGLVENSNFRRYSTFNFGGYTHPDKAPIHRLYAFNEETLAASHTLELLVSEASYILLLPITGVLSFSTALASIAPVDVEEMQVVSLPAGSTLRLSNLYDNELISFLHIWIAATGPIADISYESLPFDLAATENQLAKLLFPDAAKQHPFSVTIGRFAGRREAIYRLQNHHSHFFAFVLAGAFEIEGRLLHEHDGLALWQAEEVELEALSNHAIVIVLELI